MHLSIAPYDMVPRGLRTGSRGRRFTWNTPLEGALHCGVRNLVIMYNSPRRRPAAFQASSICST